MNNTLESFDAFDPRSEVYELAADPGRKIAAIKKAREVFPSMGLKTAKDYVEAIQAKDTGSAQRFEREYDNTFNTGLQAAIEVAQRQAEDFFWNNMDTQADLMRNFVKVLQGLRRGK